MDPQVHIVKSDFTYGRSLDRVVSYEFQSMLSEVGGGTLVYPRSGPGTEYLYAKALLVLKDSSGNPGVNAVFMIDTWEEDLIREGVGTQTRTWHLVGVAQRLGETIIYPEPGSPLALARQFPVLTTPGDYGSTFLQEAHDRGAALEIDRDWGPEHDSLGADWDEQNYAPKVTCGSTFLDWLRTNEEAGYFEWYMQGNTLRIFNPGTSGVDRTLDDANKLVLSRGYHLLDGPIRNVVTQQATSVVVFGDDERFEESLDADGIADPLIGRREAAYNARGVNRPGTLSKIGEQYLRANNGVRRNQSYKVIQGTEGDKDIGVAFDVADTVFIVDGGVATAAHPQRIRGAVRSFDAGSCTYGAIIDVSNALQERDIRIWHKISQEQAAAGGLDGGARPSQGTMPPAAPEWRALDELVSTLVDPPFGQGGQTRAQTTARVQPVAHDADGVDIGDLAGYRWYWRYTTDSAFGSLEVKITDDGFDPDDPTGVIPDMVPGATIYIYPTAFDRHGNESAAGELRTKVLAGSTGRFQVLDTLGATILDTDNESVTIFKDFRIRSDGATDTGISLDTTDGFRAWDPTTLLTIHLDVNTGDATFAGNVDITGALNVAGVTMLGGTLTMAADIDADGYEIVGGQFSTTSGAILGGTGLQDLVLADGMTIGQDGSGSLIEAPGSLGIASAGTIFTGGGVMGGSWVFATTGETVGFYSQLGTTRQTLAAAATDLATVITLANDIRASLANTGLMAL